MIDETTPLTPTAGFHVEKYPDRHHINFWKEFDNWAMYNATYETKQHISVVMGPLIIKWINLLNSPNKLMLKQWNEAITHPNSTLAIDYLASKHRATVAKYYNNSEFNSMVECFEKYGKGILFPEEDRNSSSSSMWAIWLCFVDAALRTKKDDREFWVKTAKVILIGMTFDGVTNSRFPVQNYTIDTLDEAKKDILSISDDNILAAIASFVNSTHFFQPG